MQKEREADADMYQDKEAFVTSSYRKKIEEMKALEEQEQREEYLESIGEVTRQRDLGMGYSLRILKCDTFNTILSNILNKI